jgi:hypothetical protein
VRGVRDTQHPARRAAAAAVLAPSARPRALRRWCRRFPPRRCCSLYPPSCPLTALSSSIAIARFWNSSSNGSTPLTGALAARFIVADGASYCAYLQRRGGGGGGKEGKGVVRRGGGRRSACPLRGGRAARVARTQARSPCPRAPSSSCNSSLLEDQVRPLLDVVDAHRAAWPGARGPRRAPRPAAARRAPRAAGVARRSARWRRCGWDRAGRVAGASEAARPRGKGGGGPSLLERRAHGARCCGRSPLPPPPRACRGRLPQRACAFRVRLGPHCDPALKARRPLQRGGRFVRARWTARWSRGGASGAV